MYIDIVYCILNEAVLYNAYNAVQHFVRSCSAINCYSMLSVDQCHVLKHESC